MGHSCLLVLALSSAKKISLGKNAIQNARRLATKRANQVARKRVVHALTAKRDILAKLVSTHALLAVRTESAAESLASVRRAASLVFVVTSARRHALQVALVLATVMTGHVLPARQDGGVISARFQQLRDLSEMWIRFRANHHLVLRAATPSLMA